MIPNNIAVAIYANYLEAEAAINELLHSGFDMTKLSIVGRNDHMEQNLAGYSNVDGHLKFWGKDNVLRHFLRRYLKRSFRFRLFLTSRYRDIAFFGNDHPRDGHRDLWLNKQVGAKLVDLGIPVRSVPLYETAFKAVKFVVIAHCSAAEVERAREIMIRTTPESFVEHQLPSIEAETVAVALAH